MRVLVVNSVALNVGDAAILRGVIHTVRGALGAETTIEVAEQVPDVARRLYPDVTFHAGLHSTPHAWPRWRSHGLVASLRKRRTSLAVRLLRRAPAIARWLLSRVQREHLDRMARADVVIATGGTYFVEHYDFTAKADEVRAALALGRPTFLFTQSLGPFRRARSQATMRRIVAGCAGVFLRDARSRAHLDAIGADLRRVSVHADAAFAVARPAVERSSSPGGARRRVAISVREWKHFRPDAPADARDRYRRAVAGVARALAAEGHEVVFLSTCQGVPEYWTDDSRFAAALVAELLPGEPGVSVDSGFRSPEALAATLAGFDVAIATRMHFAILALCAGTPVVAIAYEFKSRELLASMGHEAWVSDIEAVDAPGLLRSVREALDAGASLRAEIGAQVERFADDARRPGAAIAARLVAAGRRG